jgi:glycosyltransferase involved in cell wall biosynthesis
VWDQNLLDSMYAGAASYLHGHSVGGTNPSLLRAMGAGAAVTAFDVGFNREVLQETGIYFADPAAVATAVETVEASPEGAAKRGRLAREEAARRYRWDDVASAYEQLCHSLLARRQ